MKLFERNPRGYVLTGVGQRFVETAEKHRGRGGSGCRRKSPAAPTAQRGVIRMSAPEGFANFFLTHLAAGFQRRISQSLARIW